MAAYAIFVVGRYSQWLEHDADLATCVWPGGQVDRAAAESFARALIKIVGRGRESRWSQWLHPSALSRIAILGQAIADPAWPTRYRRRLSWVAAIMVALYVTSTAALVVLAKTAR